MRYRRADMKGGSYFFTVNLADRKSNLLVEHVDDLREVIKKVKQSHPFQIDAMVVLPEHLHSIWTLPPDDSDYAKRWMLIKSGFSRRISKNEHRSESRILKGERGLWQCRYWEHVIRDEQDYEHHVNYIHFNPVKHGHVANAAVWKYSSIHRYIKEGVIAPDWGVQDVYLEDYYGEGK